MKKITEKRKISKHTVKRLIIYCRLLRDAYESGCLWITSKEIAEKLAINSSQVRRDISFLGKKGKSGVGYDMKSLIDNIQDVLGLKQKWGVVLIGAGNLGRALVYYPAFRAEGFEFRLAIDNDSRKVGKKWCGMKIETIDGLKKKIEKKEVEIAVIAVPKESAQWVADELVNAGIKEILNFAPVALKASKEVTITYADLSLELRRLSYHLSSRRVK